VKILIHKEKAIYEKFVKMQVVDAVCAAGYDIQVVRENDNVGYYGNDYLFYYVEFDTDEQAVEFKLRYL
jgi:hypothetical protein